jgi:tetratricopeptide (TPR) repeat protein
MWAWRQPASVGAYNLGRAEGLLAQSRYTEAAQLLEEVLQYHSSARTRLLLSQAYLALKDVERAETQARLALERSLPHQQAAAWTQVGRCLDAAGKLGEAASAWEHALEVGRPYSSDPLVAAHTRASRWRLAMQYWRGGDYDAARPYLEILSGGNDLYAAAANLRLAQLTAPTDSPLSLSYLNKINLSVPLRGPVPSSPRTPSWAITPHSDGLPQGEELTERVEALRAAHNEAESVGKEGAGAAALATLWGTALLQQGEPELAKRTLERSVTLDPASASAHTRLALAMIALGDASGAEVQLRTAVRLNPNEPLARRALAGIFMARSDWEAVDAQLDEFERLLPGRVEPHLARAEFLALLGAYPEAEAQYEKAASVQRDGQSGEAGPDASLAAARFYIDTQSGEPACRKGLPHAQYSLRLNPDSAAALDLVGWGLVLCGEPADALGTLEKAVENAPRSPRYRYHLARVYANLGRLEEALHQLTRVNDLDPGGPWTRLATVEKARVERGIEK